MVMVVIMMVMMTMMMVSMMIRRMTMVPMAVTRGAPGYDDKSESDDDRNRDHEMI